MVKKSVQVGRGARRKCPCFGVFCFLCAFLASWFGADEASAETPLAVLKTGPFSAPAAVLGVTSPRVIEAAARAPEVLRFTFSRDLVDFAHRVEKLARDGVELNQRKLVHDEKLNLRVQSRFGGGVLQLCYRR